MYWALTHLYDLRQTFGFGEDAGAKKLEEAGGKIITASGKNRYNAVSEYAASMVHARATAGMYIPCTLQLRNVVTISVSG